MIHPSSHRARITLTLMLALGATPLAAQTQDPLSRARRAFDAGVARMDRGEYPAAIDLLESSLGIRESAVARYDLALSLRGQGLLTRAEAEAENALAEAPAADARLRDAARALRDELRATLAGLTVAIRSHDATAPAGEARPVVHPPRDRRAPSGVAAATLAVETSAPHAAIRVDDTYVGEGSVTTVVSPGTHEVTVRSSGEATQRRVVQIGAGTRQVVSFGDGHDGSVLHQWWFWTGAGLLVASAVVTGLLLSHSAHSPQGGWDNIQSAVQIAP